jgi:hypothetical protein
MVLNTLLLEVATCNHPFIDELTANTIYNRLNAECRQSMQAKSPQGIDI